MILRQNIILSSARCKSSKFDAHSLSRKKLILKGKPLFKTKRGLIVFDFGSAVDLRHPNSQEFLRRDINNITRFFAKRGIPVNEPSEIFEDIVK